MTISCQQIGKFVQALAARQSTPGGGAAAAVGAAIGAGAAQMAAVVTNHSTHVNLEAAVHAKQLLDAISLEGILQLADDDVKAFADLQRSCAMDVPLDDKVYIKARALAVPSNLLEQCHGLILQIQQFLPYCNQSIVSDAKVGIHQLAGAARAAYQTALINQPTEMEKRRLQILLREIQHVEDEILHVY